MQFVPSQSALPIGVGILVVAILVTIWRSAEIVHAYEKRALTVFGEYRTLLEPGINLVPPFVSQTHSIDMRPQTLVIPRQEAIMKEFNPVAALAEMEMTVIDPEAAFLEVEDHEDATVDLAAGTIPSQLGDREMVDAIDGLAAIEGDIRSEIEEETREWGVRIDSFEFRWLKPSLIEEGGQEKQPTVEEYLRHKGEL